VQGLPEETQCSIVDLVKARRTGGVQQRQGLAFSLHTEGLPYSPETTFVEPHNTLLMNGMHEMIDGLLSGKIVGVPGLTQFAPLLPENYSQLNRLQAFLERFTRPA